MNRRSAVACAVSDLDIPDVGRPTDGRQQRTIEINRFDCEFIRNGGLGRISKVELSNNPGPILKPDFPEEPVPDELDWNLFCGPTPLHHIFIVIFSSTATNSTNRVNTTGFAAARRTRTPI
jgi:hypothetical protein